jgi:hypothetical protein
MGTGALEVGHASFGAQTDHVQDGNLCSCR